MRRNVEPITPVTKGFIMKSQYAKAKQTSLEWEEGCKGRVGGGGDLELVCRGVTDAVCTCTPRPLSSTH